MDDERAAFEKWLASTGHYDEYTIVKARLGQSYSRPIMDYMWDAWKARSAHSASTESGK